MGTHDFNFDFNIDNNIDEIPDIPEEPVKASRRCNNETKGYESYSKRRRKFDKKTFTKRAITWLIVFGTINGTMPFLLAFLDKDPVPQMGIAWVTEILGVTIGYLCKSYFETKQERKQNLEDFNAGMTDGNDDCG